MTERELRGDTVAAGADACYSGFVGVKMNYSVRANPLLHESGTQEGKLAAVRFTADNPSGSHKEWHVGAAELDARLHLLESSGMRYGVLSKLRSGERVELPGVFSAGQLMGLGYGAGTKA